MHKFFLGIDTSAYTTSCAAVDSEGQLITSCRQLFPVEIGQRGLRQSEAVFAHIRQLPFVFEDLLSKIAAHSVAAICVSDRPVDGKDSYMPVFQVGTAFAKTLSLVLKVPLYTTTHQRGHLAAALIGNIDLQPPYTFIHLSGGTTDFIAIDNDDSFKPFAYARDLHVGQLIDRVGVALSLPFPSGRHLETLAAGYEAIGRYPAILQEGNCCFSGVEAQAMRDIKQGELNKGQIAKEIYDVIVRMVLKVLNNHVLPSQNILITGGVASSKLLRNMLLSRSNARRLPYQFYFGQASLSGDNAAGVAYIGFKKWEETNYGNFD